MAAILQAIFSNTFLDENVGIQTMISLKCVHECPVDSTGSGLAWHWTGDKWKTAPMVTQFINSSPPSVAYRHQWIGLVLVQIMACHLFHARPLSKPMLIYFQLDPWEQILMKFESKYKTFHSQKCIWKYHLRNGSHFVWGRWVNAYTSPSLTEINHLYRNQHIREHYFIYISVTVIPT